MYGTWIYSSLPTFLIGAFREVIGAGQILGMQVMPASYKPASIMILAPGAFFTLGGLVTFLNYRKIKKAKKNNEQVIEMQAGGNETVLDVETVEFYYQNK